MEATARRAAPAAFALAMFLSAALIFALQPMFSRLTTPLLGGSPAVWNTSMVFFQAALLAGYVYAHVLQRVRDLRVQAGVHALVLIAAFLVLPVQVSQAFGAPDTTRPIFWLLGTLTVSIGAPFAAASATAPLLQAWYARTGRADAHDPYYLYAASNLGSLLGLLLYPVLIEPNLGTHAQSIAWTNLYAVAAGLIIVSAGVAVAAKGPGEPPASAYAAPDARAISRERLYWLGAAALPSTLLLGVTQHISTDVASAPFLWVIPLSFYLIAFIVAFLRGAERMTPYVMIAHPLALVILAIVFFSNTNWIAGMSAHVGVLFLSSLICALALARTRPPATRLTEFYLWISLGGVVGGAAAALLAPLIFNGIYEYPLALAAIALFRPRGETQLPRLANVLAVGAFTMAAVAALMLFRRAPESALFAGGLGAAAALMAAALPQQDDRPMAHRVAFMVAALVFAAMMTYVTVRIEDFRVLGEGPPHIVLRFMQWPLIVAGFFTFAFVAHQTLQPVTHRQPYATIALGIAAPLTLLVLMLATMERALDADAIMTVVMVFMALALYTNRNRPYLLAALVLALFASVLFDDARGARLVTQQRSFFGVLRAEEYSDSNPRMPALRVLMHGTTIHGAQLVGAPGASRRPLTYYNPNTALGEATVAGLAGGETSRAALVGLGAGTSACLLRPTDQLTIFEIDPTVVRLSGPRGSTFSYVRECQPNARIELGDARLQLAEEPDGIYDVIVVDAFSSDAIPAHLLTREAVSMYMRKLTPRGIVVLHLSNRNLALVAESARVARSLGLAYRWRVSGRVDDPLAGPFGGLPASAMIIARTPDAMAALPLASTEWSEVPAPPGRPWTDDYINLPRALYEAWRGVS